MRCRCCSTVMALLAAALLAPVVASAAAPRVLPEGKAPDDARLARPKTLNDYFPFTVPASAEAWQKRSERVRRQLLVATGLWPMPVSDAAPVAVVHGLVDRGDYTVEKVYFPSYAGHFVSGNLYRPKNKPGRLPGVLCPHGHWQNGRFYDHGEEKTRQELAEGAERFERGGRYPLQARCVQLARMGCVVFHYDMVGYADSQQLAHRAGVRPEMNGPNWGFFSPQAEARLQTIMGLQTYNSVRALDWLCSRPDVDAGRIGVTGASGGGTQTFVLCAIDPRPAVAFPAVMVSTGMQGGCTCENASYLRVDTGNIEIAALMAPRPLGMVAADDWTKEIAAKGLPELKQLYALAGQPDNVMCKSLLHFPHNYNHVSRTVMYNWFNKHLALGHKEPVLEADYEPLSVEQMSVWNAEHPAPPAGPDDERRLLRAMTDGAQRQIAALLPSDSPGLAEYRRVVGGAVDVMIGRNLNDVGQVEGELASEEERDGYFFFRSLLKSSAHNEQLPALFFFPKDWNKQVVIWAHERGKAGLLDEQGQPKISVMRLINAGIAVAGVDLVYQGEFLTSDKPQEGNPEVDPPVESLRGYAGYTFGYNHPRFSQRVHDLLTLVAYVRGHAYQPEEVDLLGLNGAGPWVAAARAQAGAAVNRAVIDTAGFRFAAVDNLQSPYFLPGGAKYDDVLGMLALSAPHDTWLAGEGHEAPEVVRAAYDAAGRSSGLTMYAGGEEAEEASAIDWLLP